MKFITFSLMASTFGILLKKSMPTPKVINSLMFPLFKIFIQLICFLGMHQQHMEIPRLGSNRSYSCQPTPQPQQRRIRAESLNYTTAHGNARSLTHWAKPGIKPVSSWILAGLVNYWAMIGTPVFTLCILELHCSVCIFL